MKTSTYKYTIVKEFDQERFTEKVSKLLNDGWHLQGGVSMSRGHNCIHMAQALVKYPLDWIVKDEID